MVTTIKAIRGMNDILPDESNEWLALEKRLNGIITSYGYHQVRTPILEKTDLFHRSIGEATDIIEKEMYTFEDKNGEHLSLRPEATASCTRLILEHHLLRQSEQKIWYVGPMFRRERPQKGRYRQFHQLGAEYYGSTSVKADVELIAMSRDFWQALGLQNVTLEINTIASKAVRDVYQQKLIAFFNEHKQALDEESLRRLNTNPLRILDSKNTDIHPLISAAPKLNEHLDDASAKRFDALKNYLSQLNIDFVVNPTLVRGLDYYNDTVFEWVTDELGAQRQICSGGRYDGLAEQIGNQAAPGVGFAIGLERLLLLLKQQNITLHHSPLRVYCVAVGEDTQQASFTLCAHLRKHINTMVVINDSSESTLKKQLKKADKSNADYALIIAEEELKSNKITLKPLRNQGIQRMLNRDELTHFLQGEVNEKPL